VTSEKPLSQEYHEALLEVEYPDWDSVPQWLREIEEKIKALEALIAELKIKNAELYKEIIRWSDSGLAEKNITLEAQVKSLQEQ